VSRRWLFLGIASLLAGITASAANPAHAFCVANSSKVKIHAQSLSASGFEGDIAPNGHLCCTGKNCVNKKAKRARVLVVTGYVPVTKKKGRPGWKAECRAKVKMDEWVEVKGSLKKISCKTKKPIPNGWRKK
jgi:hypothetical protein